MISLPMSHSICFSDTFQILAATRDDIPALMRDPNRLSEILPVVEKYSERVVLGG